MYLLGTARSYIISPPGNIIWLRSWEESYRGRKQQIIDTFEWELGDE